MFRNTIASARLPSSRLVRPISSSPITNKTITEKVSEVADKVNKGVGKGLVSVIETGEHVVDATKETIGVASKKAKEKSGNVADGVRGASVDAKERSGQGAAQEDKK